MMVQNSGKRHNVGKLRFTIMGCYRTVTVTAVAQPRAMCHPDILFKSFFSRTNIKAELIETLRNRAGSSKRNRPKRACSFP